MSALKRERWTEAEIDRMPPGEHDYFDRKSGKLFESAGVERQIAKALCAFANSGGGYLILGVANNGTPDGVPLLHSRTPTREWLEQKIPRLLDFPLQDFRVHEVEPAAASRIPRDKGIFVIDVGDSALAPHQSAEDHVHYYRLGSHSVAASSFYLELLRQRLTAPKLHFELAEVQVAESVRLGPGPWVTLRLIFLVRNDGRVAAYLWRIRGTGHNLPTERAEDLIFDTERFPLEVRPGGVAKGDMTILPGDSRTEPIFVGLQLRPTPAKAIEDEVSMFQETKITFRIATETSPGEDVPIVIGRKLSIKELQSLVAKMIA
jgi:hypothetical protein